MSVELGLVIPTLNEAGNIRPLIERLDAVLRNVSWEAIFVDDDSTNGTVDILDQLVVERSNVRFVRRIGRRGLSSACVEGMLATNAPFLAVMDADLQHDETLLPKMLEALKARDLDIVVGSRYVRGGGIGDFPQSRERISRLGTKISRLVVKAPLSDPLSGFFMLRRELLDEVVHSLSLQGFKILMDIFASANRPLKFEEFPFVFQQRISGSSKLDTLVSLEFAILIGEKLFGRFIPVRFVMFILVGLSGVAVHLLALAVFFRVLDVRFYYAQAAATIIAMTTNFYFNNEFTYRDQRLRGLKIIRGLLSFYAICAIGALANFQIAEFLYDLTVPWLLAGFLGAIVGSVWNYGVSSTFTWIRD